MECKLLIFARSRRFPDWLDRWMLCRKQMGLVALALAFLHAIYTFIIPLRYNVRHKLISLVVDEVQQQPCSVSIILYVEELKANINYQMHQRYCLCIFLR